jgi:hypothetical protein
MGKYSKLVAEKSDLELEDIINSLHNYQSEYIEDFFSEIYKRNLLFDFKILMGNNVLLSVTRKLEKFPDSRFIEILKKEINDRGLKNIYFEGLKNQKAQDTHLQNEKWYIGLINNILYIFITVIVIIIFIIYKEGKIFQKENKEDKIKIDIPTKPNLPKIPPLKFP